MISKNLLVVISLFLSASLAAPKDMNYVYSGGLASIKKISNGKYISPSRLNKYSGSSWFSYSDCDKPPVEGIISGCPSGSPWGPWALSPYYFGLIGDYTYPTLAQATPGVYTLDNGLEANYTLVFLDENESMLKQAAQIDVDGGVRPDYLKKAERLRFLMSEVWGFESMTPIKYGMAGLEFVTTNATATNVCIRSISQADNSKKKIVFYTWRTPGNTWDTVLGGFANSKRVGCLGYFLPSSKVDQTSQGDLPSDKSVFVNCSIPNWSRNFGYGYYESWQPRFDEIFADGSGIVGGNSAFCDMLSNRIQTINPWPYPIVAQRFPVLGRFESLPVATEPAAGPGNFPSLGLVRTNCSGQVGRVMPVVLSDGTRGFDVNGSFPPNFWSAYSRKNPDPAAPDWLKYIAPPEPCQTVSVKVRGGKMIGRSLNDYSKLIWLDKIELYSQGVEENQSGPITEWRYLPSMPPISGQMLDFDLDEEAGIWVLDSTGKIYLSTDKGASWSQYADVGDLFTEGTPNGFVDSAFKLRVSGRKSWDKVVFGLVSFFGQLAVGKGTYSAMTAKKNLSLFNVAGFDKYDWTICSTIQGINPNTGAPNYFGHPSCFARADISVDLDAPDSHGNVVASVPGISKASHFAGSIFMRLLDDQLFSLTPALITDKINQYFATWREATYGVAATKVLSAQEMSILTTAQLGAISAESIASVAPADFAKFTVDQLKKFPISRIPSITNDQLVLLNVDQFSAIAAGLSARQLIAKMSSLTSAQVQALNFQNIGAGQLQALSPSQVASLTTSQMGTIPANMFSLNNLLIGSRKVLLPNQILALSLDQFNVIKNELSPNQVRLYGSASPNLAADKISALTKDQFIQLPPMVFNGMSKEQIQALDPVKHIPFLTKIQMDAMAPINPSYVSKLEYFTDAQFAALTLAQMKFISEANLNGMSEEKLKRFTAEQVAAFDVSAFGVFGDDRNPAVYGQKLTIFKGKITAAQFQALYWNNNIQPTMNLARWWFHRQVYNNSLTYEQVSDPNFNVSFFNDKEIVLWATNVPSNWAIQSLTNNSVKLLLPKFTPTHYQRLSGFQIQSIPPDSIPQIPTLAIKALAENNVLLYYFTSDQWKALTPDQIKAIPATNMGALLRSKVKFMTQAQFQALSPAQIAAADIWSLCNWTPAQLSVLSDEQIKALPAAALENQYFGYRLAPSAIGVLKGKLSAAQVASINKPTVDGEGFATSAEAYANALSDAEVDAIVSTPENAKNLTKIQIQCLTPGQIDKLISLLSENQIINFLPRQFWLMSPTSFRKISSDTIEKIPFSRFENLTLSQTVGILPDGRFDPNVALTQAQQISISKICTPWGSGEFLWSRGD